MGEHVAAIIDPGPFLDDHLAVLAGAVSDATEVVILLTHAHSDHSAGAQALARRIGAEVVGPGSSREMEDGAVVGTSTGPLVAVATPGHALRHFCFHLPPSGAVFVGDLILGEGDTTWIGEYPGGVADYLRSLDRLESLGASVLYPGHGDPIRNPEEAIRRFRRHRLGRIGEVRRALEAGNSDDPRTLASRVYGPLPAEIFGLAVRSIEGILDYLSRPG